jgi:amidophosphoribosyltransferase
VDDSIVRGTTSRKIVELVKRSGAKKVYFVSTCPPIRFPCFYGIDFPDRNELIAAKCGGDMKQEEVERMVAKELGADGVVYQDMSGLVECLKTQSGGEVAMPCTACLDGCYPADVSESSKFLKQRQMERK